MKNQPLVTIALLAYNQEKYIMEAVNSILSQDCEPLQIIISDDCSIDKTYSIATMLVDKYNGPHQITLNRNEKNLGVGRHINRIMELSKGELIIAAGGDDISLPNRVADTIEMWRKTGKKYLSICSEMLMIDEEGECFNKLPKVKPVTFDKVLEPHARWIYGASHAWHKSLFDIFGRLRDDVVSEDKAIGFRSLLLGQEIGCIEKPLVKYRFHAANITRGSTTIESLQQKIGTFGSYLEDFDKARSLGYLTGRDDTDNVYREITQIHTDFKLRHKILTSGFIKSTILLMTCGNKLSIQQKKNLFIKNLRVKNNRVVKKYVPG